MLAASPSSEALVAANLRRLMAKMDMTLVDLAEATELDQRTLRSILLERSRPHARTLHKLAEGLGAEVDELFEQPGRGAAAYHRAAFDRATNPVAAEVVSQRPELFADWSTAEFDELFSRVGVGGELTEEGAIAAAEAINRRRELMTQAAVVLETDQGDLLREFIEMLYRRVTEDVG